MQYEGDVVKKVSAASRADAQVGAARQRTRRSVRARSGQSGRRCRARRIGRRANCRQSGIAVQRTVDADASVAFAPDLVADVLHGSGQPLDGSTRSTMEDRLGFDFSRVRIHTDAQAAERARSPGTGAPVGSDVVFGAGQYAHGASKASASSRTS